MELEIRKLRRKGDWVGGWVRSKRDISTGAMLIPAGTDFEVRRSFGGLSLLSAACPACGVRMRVIKVPERDVEYLGHPKEAGT